MTDMQIETAIAEVRTENALDLFTQEGGVDPILERIRSIVTKFNADVSTAKGRKEIASIAHTVARSKTYLDGVGKELVDQYKKIPKQIDVTRKNIRDTLDALKDDVRSPLTEWENAEKARVELITASIDEFEATAADTSERTSEALREHLNELRNEALSEQFYAEFIGKAVEARDKAAAATARRLAEAEQREQQAAELARLREEAAERNRKEREAAIAKEAEEQAAARAAEAARAEREATARKEAQLILEKEQAELKAAQAEQRAREEIEAASRREKDAAEQREANQRHRTKINNAATAALISNGIPEDTAKSVVALIASKQIPSVQIQY